MATYTQTTTIANGNSADGGEINTEIVNLGASVNSIVDAQISPSANIAISKTTLKTFTDWTAWTPGFTGFSSNPTVNYSKYTQIGNIVTVVFRMNAIGTSNATSFTITGLPVALSASAPATLFFPMMRCRDDGTYISTGMAQLAAGATTLTLFKDHIGTTWTNSGNKGVDSFIIQYPVD